MFSINYEFVSSSVTLILKLFYSTPSAGALSFLTSNSTFFDTKPLSFAIASIHAGPTVLQVTSFPSNQLWCICVYSGVYMYTVFEVTTFPLSFAVIVTVLVPGDLNNTLVGLIIAPLVAVGVQVLSVASEGVTFTV